MDKQKVIISVGLIAVEIILLITGFGEISNGSLSITILHIPVILAAILLGLPYGGILGGIFGIGTMVAASGYGAETLDHQFVNPILSIVPRLLIALAAWFVYRFLKKHMDDDTISSECIAGGGAALAGTVTNTVAVTILLCILHPDMLGGGSELSAYVLAFVNILGANTSIEICISILIVSIVIFFIKKREMQDVKTTQIPMRKTFQKWLVVFMTGGFLVTLLSSYTLQTIQDRENADIYLEVILTEVIQGIEKGEAYNTPTSLRAGSKGTILLVEDETIIHSGNREFIGKKLTEVGFSMEEVKAGKDVFLTVLSGSTYFCKAMQSGDMTVIGMMLGDEIYADRNQTAMILLFVNFVIFVTIFLLISKLLQDNVVDRIYHVNQSLSMIQNGNLDELVEVRNNAEFSVLSDGINATVHALKETMEEVAAKINQEMEFAREIQRSALPAAEHVIPRFHEYEICGIMDAAREVGGDFYDYFLVEEQKLGVVIADVSGKGVPAALFMMTAKTLLKNFVLNGKSPAEALELANMQLCENNETGMFVTVWLGILDYSAGTLTFANAGHNPPLLKKAGEPFVYMDHKTYKRSIMLGMREGIRYRNNQITFTRGDMLYLYTDGVTEANNEKEELYGEDRLLHCMEENYDQAPEQLVQTIWKDIDRFAGKAEQFDDITMVALKMYARWKTITLNAVYENTEIGAKFVEENLPEECSPKVFHQIAIAFDEIYSNVVKYSSATQLELKLGILNDMIYLVFVDDGIPYNPLESVDPEIDAPKSERKIGGLGLFVVKQTMDYVDYQYQEQRNRFSIGKKFV